MSVTEKHALKKRRLASGAPEVADSADELDTWLELARLYKSVGDLDALRGIFSSRIASSAMTLQALDCEANADYSTAERIYRQVLVMLSICIHVHVAECPVLFASSFVLLNFLARFCPIFVLADHIRDDTTPVEKKTFILIPQSLV